ncbi:MAG: hypothetical protein R3B45_17150 [Bdellovibrionota bacterium]
MFLLRIKKVLLCCTPAILLTVVISCGAGEQDDTTTTSATLNWTTDVAPIVASSCGGSGCHEQGKDPGGVIYVGNEANFKASKTDTIKRLNLSSSNNDYMPRDSSLSAANKEKLINFLNQ